MGRSVLVLVISTPTSELLLTQPRYLSPVLITPSGTVAGTAIGISAKQSDWTIENHGVVWGGQVGLLMGAANGTVVNPNLIYNGLNAVVAGGTIGLLAETTSQITNNGLIAASGGGIGVVLSSGIVLDGASGDIVGGSIGLLAAGTSTSTIVANGLIAATSGQSNIGVVAGYGGVIVNGVGALIVGSDGVIVGAGTAASTVSNLGGIFGLGTANSSTGLFLAAGSVVLNGAGGTIASQYGSGVVTGRQVRPSWLTTASCSGNTVSYRPIL